MVSEFVLLKASTLADSKLSLVHQIFARQYRLNPERILTLLTSPLCEDSAWGHGLAEAPVSASRPGRYEADFRSQVSEIEAGCSVRTRILSKLICSQPRALISSAPDLLQFVILKLNSVIISNDDPMPEPSGPQTATMTSQWLETARCESMAAEQRDSLIKTQGDRVENYALQRVLASCLTSILLAFGPEISRARQPVALTSTLAVAADHIEAVSHQLSLHQQCVLVWNVRGLHGDGENIDGSEAPYALGTILMGSVNAENRGNKSSGADWHQRSEISFDGTPIDAAQLLHSLWVVLQNLELSEVVLRWERRAARCAAESNCSTVRMKAHQLFRIFTQNSFSTAPAKTSALVEEVLFAVMRELEELNVGRAVLKSQPTIVWPLKEALNSAIALSYCICRQRTISKHPAILGAVFCMLRSAETLPLFRQKALHLMLVLLSEPTSLAELCTQDLRRDEYLHDLASRLRWPRNHAGLAGILHCAHWFDDDEKAMDIQVAVIAALARVPAGECLFRRHLWRVLVRLLTLTWTNRCGGSTSYGGPRRP